MQYTIAIQPDDYTNKSTPEKIDAASPQWARYLEAAGHKVKWVDVRRPDIIDQLKGCHGFMWRWAHFDGMGRIARRLLPIVEREMGLAVYPDQNTCWHYDDKIAQAYLLKAAGISIPETWIFFDREQAMEWASRANYPLVLKLSAGAGSSNVRLVENIYQAQKWVDHHFTRRMINLDDNQINALVMKQRIKEAAKVLMRGRIPGIIDNGIEMQSGYILFQEFLPGNDFTIRVIVIGERAWSLRRFNRPNDFRASDNGNIDKNPEKIPNECIKEALLIAMKLNLQSIGIDFLKKKGVYVVSEMSYTFPRYKPWDIHPGYWDSQINYITQVLSFEKEIVDQLLINIKNRSGT